MNAVFKAQFNYYSIIWMFHSRSLNSKINRLHEQCLGIIYNISIRYNNIHALPIELDKIANDMSPKIMSEVFKLRDFPCYNLRHTSQSSADPIHSVYDGTESASYLGPNIWEQIPVEIKNKGSLDGFKRDVKKWKPVERPCRICRNLYLI